jgi:hypothetical protein
MGTPFRYSIPDQAEGFAAIFKSLESSQKKLLMTDAAVDVPAEIRHRHLG